MSLNFKMFKMRLTMNILLQMWLLPLKIDGWVMWIVLQNTSCNYKNYIFQRPFSILIANHTEEIYSSKVQLNATFTESNKFNFNVEFLEIVREPFLHVGLYFESSEGVHDLEIMNRTIDLCKFYKNKRYEPILQVIFKLFEETMSHWTKSCPMQKVNYLFTLWLMHKFIN